MRKISRVLLISSMSFIVITFLTNFFLTLYLYQIIGNYNAKSPTTNLASVMTGICVFWIAALCIVVITFLFYDKINACSKNRRIIILISLLTIEFGVMLAGSFYLTSVIYIAIFGLLALICYTNVTIITIKGNAKQVDVSPQSFNALYAAQSRASARRMGYVFLVFGGCLIVLAWIFTCYFYVEQLYATALANKELWPWFFKTTFAKQLINISAEFALPLAWAFALFRFYRQTIKNAAFPFLLLMAITVMLGLWSCVGGIIEIKNHDLFGMLGIGAAICCWIAAICLLIARKEPDHDLEEAMIKDYNTKTAFDPSLVVMPKPEEEPQPDQRLPNLDWQHWAIESRLP